MLERGTAKHYRKATPRRAHGAHRSGVEGPPGAPRHPWGPWNPSGAAPRSSLGPLGHRAMAPPSGRFWEPGPLGPGPGHSHGTRKTPKRHLFGEEPWTSHGEAPRDMLRKGASVAMNLKPQFESLWASFSRLIFEPFAEALKSSHVKLHRRL